MIFQPCIGIISEQRTQLSRTFATIRHRTRQTKGCESRLATSAEKHWKQLKGHELISKVIKGVPFKNGEEVKDQEQIA